MIGKVFSGSRELFNAAIADHEVEQGSDGLFYYATKSKRKELIHSEGAHASRLHNVANEEQLRGLLAGFATEIEDNPDWCDFGTQSISKRAKPALDSTASQHDHQMLQESFDAVTRVTTQIRKVGHDLLNLRGGQGGAELARRGLALCRSIVEPQAKVEELMLREREQVTSMDVKTALQECAGPYRELIEFYNELVALHKHHHRDAGSSGSGAGSAGKFKTMSL